MNDYRHVCFKDLENYVKKSDYFGGLTDLEKEVIRHNLDIPSNNDLLEKLGGIVELTYEKLKEIVDSLSLNPYCLYVINDFLTIYESNVDVDGIKETWGTDLKEPSNVYSIVLNPISNSLFSQDVEVLQNGQSKNWIVRYDFNQETLSDGTTTKGKILYLLDENNNSAYYDFKNIKFQVHLDNSDVTSLTTGGNYRLYTFSSYKQGKFIENSEEAFNNTFDLDCYNNVFLGTVINNHFYGGFKNNIFLDDCKYNKFEWQTFGNKFTGSVMYAQGSLQNALVTTTNYDSTLSKEFKMLHSLSEAKPVFVVTVLDADTLTTQVNVINLQKR